MVDFNSQSRTLQQWVEFASGVKWRKQVGSRTFTLELKRDLTLAEWLTSDPADVWAGTWEPILIEHHAKPGVMMSGSVITRIGPFVAEYNNRLDYSFRPQDAVLEAVEFDTSAGPIGQGRGYRCTLEPIQL